MRLPSHGSNSKYVYESMQLDQPENVIDFSVNLNPLGAPAILEKEWEQWFSSIHDYPDPQASLLVKQIAEQESIPEEHILIGNGAAEMITLLARYLSGKKVIIVHPAFSEYETACRNENCEVVHFILDGPDWQLNLTKLEEELTDAAAVFLCNPNNPTGVHYKAGTVSALIEMCDNTNTYCVIDEAFYDFLDKPVSYIQEVTQNKRLFVLRSLTKIYSIAGLRLGFLAGSPELLEKIGKTQPHWSVNALAMKAGAACLQDRNHVGSTQKYIESEREKIFEKLEHLGYEHSASQINFYLLRDPDFSHQKDLFSNLLKQGIVLRHTENFPGIKGRWLRVAVKTAKDNDVLMEALAAWKKGK